MTDTPIQAPTFPPPTKLDQAKAFIGDLARPFAIIVTSLSAAVTPIIIAFKIGRPDLSAAAVFIGAIYAGVGAIYGFKAWEVARTGKQTSDVAIAQAQTQVTP